VTRIILTLAVLSTLLLIAAFVLGLNIDDPKSLDPAEQTTVSHHLLTALAGLVFATLVHAIVLTYFVGTGRWMEETAEAYSLPADWKNESRSLKFRILPAILGCFVLLVLTAALGAAADPASPVDFQGWGGLSAGMIHSLCAATAVTVNLLVNLWEYQAVARNSQLINGVLQEVRRIRTERGLPV